MFSIIFGLILIFFSVRYLILHREKTYHYKPPKPSKVQPEKEEPMHFESHGGQKMKITKVIDVEDVEFEEDTKLPCKPFSR